MTTDPATLYIRYLDAAGAAHVRGIPVGDDPNVREIRDHARSIVSAEEIEAADGSMWVALLRKNRRPDRLAGWRYTTPQGCWDAGRGIWFVMHLVGPATGDTATGPRVCTRCGQQEPLGGERLTA